MCSLLHFKVAVMGCHLDPAVMYCYAGNVELVLAVLVGLKGHTFIKGCGQEGGTTPIAPGTCFVYLWSTE